MSVQVQDRVSTYNPRESSVLSQVYQDTSMDVDPTPRPRQIPVPDMPIYWRIDYVLGSSTNPLFRWFWWLEAVAFQFLCVIAFAKTELNVVWEIIHDPPAFKEMKDQLSSQVNNTSVMAGLLLATTAVFLTTDTPREDMLRFSDSTPYALLLFSFGVAMCSILGGCTLQLIAQRCSCNFFVALTSSRLRLACTLILIAYPLFSLSLACLVCGTGLLVASITSSRSYVKAGGIFLVSLPVLLFLVFVGLALAPTVETFRTNLRASQVPGDLERGSAKKLSEKAGL